MEDWVKWASGLAASLLSMVLLFLGRRVYDLHHRQAAQGERLMAVEKDMEFVKSTLGELKSGQETHAAKTDALAAETRQGLADVRRSHAEAAQSVIQSIGDLRLEIANAKRQEGSG